MMKSRKHHTDSDPAEDRPAHRHNRHPGLDQEPKMADSMASHDCRSHEGRLAHRHGRHARNSDDKHRRTESAHRDGASRASNHRRSRRHGDETESDTSDEILIKCRASRRSTREKDKDISRQLKNIEKAQREALRPSSSSSQEIHIHYVPVITNSASPPLASSRDSRSLSSAASNSDARAIRKSKSQGVSASELTNQLKDMTISWVKKRDHAHKTSSRSKHEKRDKHGKKKDTFLAPLAQRWVCYNCGKLRSDTIQHRHPLREGQKMQPNWCGKCRVFGEVKGRPLEWHGQRHYCWGCGIVRSEKYHRENRLDDDQASMPNYCKRCRELSPSFGYNLRETSEFGSVISVSDKLRDKAFSRQMKDADLSEVGGDEDYRIASAATGRENHYPHESKKVEAHKSFILHNCSQKTKTTSDTSSEGGVPLDLLKAAHLEADRARSSGDGGARTAASYAKPLSVDSLGANHSTARASKSTVDGGTDLLAEECNKASESPNTGPCVDDKLRRASSGAKAHQDGPGISSSISKDCQPDGPTVVSSNSRETTTDSKKKVHWTSDTSRHATCASTLSVQSQSAFSSGYRSEVSMRSTGSRGRSRRNPAEYSSGSPPEQEGASSIGNIGDSVRGRQQHEGSSTMQQENDSGSLKQGPPSHGAVGQSSNIESHMPQPQDPAFPSCAVPRATPPDSYNSRDGVDCSWDTCNEQSPTQKVPNFSRPSSSPSKLWTDGSSQACDDSGYSSGCGTRPDYLSRPYTRFQSAVHFSDSATRRDFSGYEAPADAGSYDYSPPQYDDYAAGHDNCFEAPQQPGPANAAAFDFSQFGETSKFTRSKDRTPRMKNRWRLYDDGDSHELNARNCEWRDGQTTVHQSGSGKAPQSAKSSSKVTILSIREMKSDEELSGVGGQQDDDDDDDDASELETVIGKPTH